MARQALRALAAAVAALVLWGTVPLPAAPPEAPGNARFAADLEKRALRAARGGKPELRRQILGELALADPQAALDAIVRVGFSTGDEGVRAEARACLARHRGEQAFAASLAERVARELGSKRADTAAELAAVLLAAPWDGSPRPLDAWLDGPDGSTPAVAKLCWTVATAAASRGTPEDVAALVGLSRIGLFARDFSFRRGTVRGLVAIHTRESVEALVGLLDGLPGEARADVVAYLAHVGGVNHGIDAAGWKAWFAEHRDRLVLPPELADYPPPRMPLVSPDARDPAYYGIPLYAARVVFVVDTSSSMEERGRLEKAKRELESAVFILPPEAEFTIVAYSDRAVAWERRLVAADEGAKRRAAAFIRTLVPDGRTATGDALDLAFSFDTEAVYLLSDGKPTAGRVVEPAAIVRMVAAANANRRVSLHAIGIAPDPGLAEFLEILARANFGQFRRVDE